jgi:hypothetical protein
MLGLHFADVSILFIRWMMMIISAISMVPQNTADLFQGQDMALFVNERFYLEKWCKI